MGRHLTLKINFALMEYILETKKTIYESNQLDELIRSVSFCKMKHCHQQFISFRKCY